MPNKPSKKPAVAAYSEAGAKPRPTTKKINQTMAEMKATGAKVSTGPGVSKTVKKASARIIKANKGR
jgi:hypothetical protein